MMRHWLTTACAAVALLATALDDAQREGHTQVGAGSAKLAEQVEHKTEVPSAVAVLERAIDAMGGREALEGITSAMYYLASDEGDGGHHVVHIMRGAAERVAYTYGRTPEFDGARLQENQVGLSNDLAWKVSFLGDSGVVAELAMPQDVMDHIFIVGFHRQVLDLIPLSQQATVQVGVMDEMLGQQPHTVISFPRNSNGTKRRVYFDETSGLPALLDVKYNMKHAEWTLRLQFQDWAQQGNIVIYHTLVQEHRMGGPHTYSVSAAFNRVEDEAFEVPPWVHMLVERQEDAVEMIRWEQAITEMTKEQLREELIRISKERVAVRGTMREVLLRHQFRQLLERLRALTGQIEG